VGQNRESDPWRSVLAAALLYSGRPVLVVPDIHNGSVRLSKLVIAWDGGARAARAVADALPLLRKANTVEIVGIAGQGSAEIEADLVAVARHLERHGIAAETRKLWGEDIAETLLSHLADVGPDLLVMGGYGRLQMRETLFGGTTQGILASMTVPVLMAH